MGEFLYNRLIYIYEFWNRIYLWGQGLLLSGKLPFGAGELIAGPSWKMWLFLGVVAILYLAFCLVMVKIAKGILGLINAHMCNHNAALGLNMPLYIAALALIFFDDRVFGAPGRHDDGVFHIGAFTLLAGVLFLIAVIRMIRRAGLRFVYFIPLQASFFAVMYLYLLLWAPAAVIVFVLVVTGMAMAANDPKSRVCPYCGATITPGVTCPCGRSTGAYS
jgi:hypothetical protein